MQSFAHRGRVNVTHSVPSQSQSFSIPHICHNAPRQPSCAARMAAVQQQITALPAKPPLHALSRCPFISRQRQTVTRCDAAPQSVQFAVRGSLQGPDWQFEHPTGAQVCVFGVEHLERESHIGEWILANRPAAVIVETACTPEHGAAPGRAVTCRDQVPGAAGMFLRVFCQIAAALQEQGEAAMAPGGIWSQAASQFNGEQLAYIAALATGAQLLFGDRPKDVTYRRLFSIPTIEELDAAFAAEVSASYSSSLFHMQQQEHQYNQWQRYQQQLSSTCVWDILMKEREAVMLGVIDDVSSRGLLSMPGLPKPTVVLVVGAAHIPGLQQLWASGSWRDMIGSDGVTSTNCPIMQAPRLDHSNDNMNYNNDTMVGKSSEDHNSSIDEAAGAAAGAKRGLLESVLALSMPPEVLEDLQEVLPAVPDDQAVARQFTWEVYGTYRMQLAALPDELLLQVCSGMTPGSSMLPVLEPLRQLRPVNGGTGWSEEAVMKLRTLNFDLSGGGEADAEE